MIDLKLVSDKELDSMRDVAKRDYDMIDRIVADINNDRLEKSSKYFGLSRSEIFALVNQGL